MGSGTALLISPRFAPHGPKPPACFLCSPLGGIAVVGTVVECRPGAGGRHGILQPSNDMP